MIEIWYSIDETSGEFDYLSVMRVRTETPRTLVGGLYGVPIISPNVNLILKIGQIRDPLKVVFTQEEPPFFICSDDVVLWAKKIIMLGRIDEDKSKY